MRIVPPVIGGFKQAKVDVVYGGYTIPKGWKVGIYCYLFIFTYLWRRR